MVSLKKSYHQEKDDHSNLPSSLSTYELRVFWTSANLLASFPEELILSIIQFFCLLVENLKGFSSIHGLINPGMFMLGDWLDAFDWLRDRSASCLHPPYQRMKPNRLSLHLPSYRHFSHLPTPQQCLQKSPSFCRSLTWMEVLQSTTQSTNTLGIELLEVMMTNAVNRVKIIKERENVYLN